MSAPYPSWGGIHAPNQTPRPLYNRHAALPRNPDAPQLPRGMGRSYGDVCLNPDGELLLTPALDRLIAFDPQTGRLQCEAGLTMRALLDFAVPRGWFPPVTPGTAHVTLGGCIANDVHGKNHHRAGTFGAHVLSFELLRHDGARLHCSRTSHADRFRATIGGLGLTGLITRLELQLRPIHNPWMQAESIAFPHLNAFWELTAASDTNWEYTVAWIDTLATGDQLGRGIFHRGKHAPAGITGTTPKKTPRATVPIHAPARLLNRHTIRAFNHRYRRTAPHSLQPVHYQPFFYPLDTLGHWNKLYGRPGFFQHQSLLPADAAPKALPRLLRRIAESDQASFLAVLKCFGNQSPEGLLSFPRAGVTLALDFPNRGDPTRTLLHELNRITLDHGGALYPAKDATMTPEHFHASHPALDLFLPHVDPAFSSGFARRVHLHKSPKS